MKRYVLAGASSRAYNMYAVPMYQDYSDCVELCGIFDVNRGRSEYISKRCGNIPVYDSFEEMLEQQKPDVVIVTTVDAYHSKYIIASLYAGCDVITEKPMTTDEVQCNAILRAEKESGHKVTVTFNYRYAPYMTKVKQLIQDGAIGDVMSVHFEWMLTRCNNAEFGAHGTSYFRRWNARMEKSGGLLIHKSTHHFDLVNWWLDSSPEEVFAYGKRNLYGDKRLPGASHCRACNLKSSCPFYYELTDFEKEFYVANEKYDGYLKDGCVFAEDIDIYDTMAVAVSYKNKAMMTYTLNATTPFEGWTAVFNGTKGRLEACELDSRPGDEIQSGREIFVYDLDGNKTSYWVAANDEAHGGGDVRLRDMLFRGKGDNRYGHAAGTMAGAYSILIGIAANKSIRENKPIFVADLLEK